jgi:hypothetical protein
MHVPSVVRKRAQDTAIHSSSRTGPISLSRRQTRTARAGCDQALAEEVVHDRRRRFFTASNSSASAYLWFAA